MAYTEEELFQHLMDTLVGDKKLRVKPPFDTKDEAVADAFFPHLTDVLTKLILTSEKECGSIIPALNAVQAFWGPAGCNNGPIKLEAFSWCGHFLQSVYNAGYHAGLDA